MAQDSEKDSEAQEVLDEVAEDLKKDEGHQVASEEGDIKSEEEEVYWD